MEHNKLPADDKNLEVKLLFNDRLIKLVNGVWKLLIYRRF